MASLSAAGRPSRILAWAYADRGYCVGSPTALSVGDEESWRHVGWHEIERGGWNSELRQLAWTEHDGHRGSVTLPEPGRLPELFRERVAATIALERFVPLVGERGVIISARRDLADGGVITWHRTLTRGLSWRTEGVEEAAAEALAALRTEWDTG